ncbi:MAG: hypothetical protein H0W04_06880 [Chthoniobacterales bacterium]|nr:hypothetical protein [Chthoniobacterales bacterium]
MKKFITILAGAALFAACEHRTEVTAPGASPAGKSETNTTIVNPSPTITPATTNTTNTTITTMPTAAATATPISSMDSTTPTTTSPEPTP